MKQGLYKYLIFNSIYWIIQILFFKYISLISDKFEGGINEIVPFIIAFFITIAFYFFTNNYKNVSNKGIFYVFGFIPMVFFSTSFVVLVSSILMIFFDRLLDDYQLKLTYEVTLNLFYFLSSSISLWYILFSLTNKYFISKNENKKNDKNKIKSEILEIYKNDILKKRFVEIISSNLIESSKKNKLINQFQYYLNSINEKKVSLKDELLQLSQFIKNIKIIHPNIDIKFNADCNFKERKIPPMLLYLLSSDIINNINNSDEKTNKVHIYLKDNIEEGILIISIRYNGNKNCSKIKYNRSIIEYIRTYNKNSEEIKLRNLKRKKQCYIEIPFNLN